MQSRDIAVLSTMNASSVAMPMMAPQYSSPTLSLSQLFSILMAWRRLSLLIAGVVVLAVGIACAFWPRTYEATTTLMVNFEVNDPLGGQEFPTGLLGSYMATQVELARGSEVLLAVIERLKLAGNPLYSAGYQGDQQSLSNWIEAVLRKQLLIEQGRYGSQLLYVTFSASSAAEAARIANAVADVYSEQQHRRLTGPATERARRYTEQLAELKAKVIRAQENVTGFRHTSGLVDSDAKIDLDMQALATQEQRLMEAQNTVRIASARASARQSVGSEVLNSPTIQTLKSQLAVQGARLSELRETMGSRYPQVLELQSQIASTRSVLDAELRAYSGNTAEDLASARKIESQQQQAVDEQRIKVTGTRELQDAGAKYLLELESAQSVYKRALDGYDQIMFASNGAYNNLSFVSRATPPTKASKPKLRLAMLLALVGGGGLGIAIPLAYEFFNRRIRCRDDIETDHGIPVLIELYSFPGFRPAHRSSRA